MFLISKKGWTSNLYWERELKSYVLPIRAISRGGRARNIKPRSLWNEKFNPEESELLIQTNLDKCYMHQVILKEMI